VQEVGEGAVTRWDDFAAPPALLVALLLSGVLLLPLCYAGALMLGSVCSRFYTRLPPRPLSAAVFVFLVALIAALEGTVGLAVAGCALALGLVPPVAGVKRVHLMGAVLIPVALRLLLGG
jgi:TctA family transporter